MATTAVAQEPSKPLITVVGESSLAVAPNLARIRGGVVSEAKTAREASEANRKTMAAVITAIKSLGIPESDIQTSRYSIHPIDREPVPNSFKGFRASNNVVINVRELDRIGELIDRMVMAGANQMSGVEFSVADSTRMLDAARSDAFADARRKAELYAKTAGVSLGRAVSITDQSSGFQPVYMPHMRAAQAAETPIAAGEITLRASVTVGFELK